MSSPLEAEETIIRALIFPQIPSVTEEGEISETAADFMKQLESLPQEKWVHSGFDKQIPPHSLRKLFL